VTLKLVLDKGHFITGDQVEDKVIIQLFNDRSEMAIHRTSEKYGSYLMKICMNVLNNREESEECTNDTYFTAWNQIPPDRPRRFLPYLGRIAKNSALNRYDYLKAAKRNRHFDVVLSELEYCITDVNQTEDYILEKELAGAISQYLRTLDENSRKIFIRRYWYSDSVREIGKMFGISQSNTKVILHRTRKNMKIYLEKEGYDL